MELVNFNTGEESSTIISKKNLLCPGCKQEGKSVKTENPFGLCCHKDFKNIKDELKKFNNIFQKILKNLRRKKCTQQILRMNLTLKH